MAQYRFSAQIISRSTGRSAVAAAAYRAAEAIHDQRTGVIHDYSRKNGVVHAEIMAPESTPDWMLDRHKLWNGVEAAEKRKDSQLAREVLLSLPYELSREQHIELVRGYVREAYVDRNLIVDFAIHAPDKGTDERNHHAHIMITMRELTGEGFGAKLRPTKARKDELKAERALWAEHQNRLFERLNMAQRVDHRSFLDRGIDRMPTVHLGPKASALEKKNQPSRRGDENRKIVQDNSRIAEGYRRDAENDNASGPKPPPPSSDRRTITPVFQYRADPAPKTKRERAWAQRDWERIVDLQTRESHALLDLDHRQHPQRLELAGDQERRNGMMKRTMQAEIDAIDARAKAGGVTRFFRNLFGVTRRDAQDRALLVKTLEGIDRREAEERRSLEIRHSNEKLRVMERYKRLRAKLETTLAVEKDRRQRNLTSVSDRDKDRKQTAEQAQGRRTTQTERPPPKPEPTLQPAPPRGAGRPLMPADREKHEQNVEKWARSEEGKRVWQHGATPPARADWSKSSSPDPAPKRDDFWNEPKPAAEQKPEPRVRDDWWNAAEPPAPSKKEDRDRD